MSAVLILQRVHFRFRYYRKLLPLFLPSFLPHLLFLFFFPSLSNYEEHLILFTSTLGTPTCHVLQRVEAGDLHSPSWTPEALELASPLARWIVSRKRGARTGKHGMLRISRLRLFRVLSKFRSWIERVLDSYKLDFNKFGYAPVRHVFRN